MPPFQIAVDTGFPWEALATAITGALAVAGAVWIGRKQVQISDKQTEIQAALAKIEEEKLRAELFDKRFAVYDATARFIGETLARGRFPQDDTRREFELALDRSKFLFPPSVKRELVELHNKAIALDAAVDGRAGLQIYFSERLETLADLFGDELRLGDQ
jgi:hypothetical protein